MIELMSYVTRIQAKFFSMEVSKKKIMFNRMELKTDWEFWYFQL